MKFKLLLACALLAGAVTTSCVDDIPGIDAKEQYTRDFVKTFGVFDPKHDWSYATRTTVTVNTTENSDIKILADVSGRRYEFGSYLNVNGSAELKVDIPKGVDKLYVKANGQTYTTIPGGTVNIASREEDGDDVDQMFDTYDEITFCNRNGKDIIKASHVAAHIFDSEDILDIVDKNSGLLPEEHGENILEERVNNNFSFHATAGSSMTFYPLYRNTGSTHSLGIYWLSKDEQYRWYVFDNEETRSTIDCSTFISHSQDLYQTRAGGISIKYDGESAFHAAETGNESYDTGRKGQIKTTGIRLDFEDDVTFGFFLKVKASTNPLVPDKTKNYNVLLNDESPLYKTNDRVTPPFIISQWAPSDRSDFINHIFFSQAVRNADFGRILKHEGDAFPHIGDDEIKLDDDGASWVCIKSDCSKKGQKLKNDYPDLSFNHNNYAKFSDPQSSENNFDRAGYVHWPKFDESGNMIKNRYYFVFEDWAMDKMPGGEGADLNDLIFIMEELFITPVDPNGDPIPDEYGDETPAKFPWIIACEDLGLNDFDFNDVVFGVSAPEADYNGSSEVMSQKVKIYPLAAGGTLPISLWYTDEKGEPKCVSLDGEEKEFHSYFGAHYSKVVNAHKGKLTPSTDEFITITVGKDWSLVGEDNEIDHKNIYSNDHMGGFYVKVNDDERRIEAPKLDEPIGSAPQMICLPSTWFWPIEKQPIDVVYEEFRDWAGDRTSNTDWHKSYKDKNLVVEHSYGGSSTSGGSGGGSTTPGGDDKTEQKEPDFSLTKAEIVYGETSQIRVGNSTSLAGITLQEINYSVPGVVEVNANGLVTALKAGTTTITFTSTGTNDYKASTGSVTITVKEITPTFKLDNSSIEPGGTAHIVLSDGSPLGEITLTPGKYGPNDIVELYADGTIKVSSNVTETTDVEITFDSNAVTGRYASTSGNTLTIKIVTSIPGIDVPLKADYIPEDTKSTNVGQYSLNCYVYEYTFGELLKSKFNDAKSVTITFLHNSGANTFLSFDNFGQGTIHAGYTSIHNSTYSFTSEEIQGLQNANKILIAFDANGFNNSDEHAEITFTITY